MENIWIILMAVVLFLVITFLYWKMTKGYAEKVNGKKMFNQWNVRMYYWTGIIMASGLLTVFVIMLLK